jgi:hypothetical protein
MGVIFEADFSLVDTYCWECLFAAEQWTFKWIGCTLISYYYFSVSVTVGQISCYYFSVSVTVGQISYYYFSVSVTVGQISYYYFSVSVTVGNNNN